MKRPLLILTILLQLCFLAFLLDNLLFRISFKGNASPEIRVEAYKNHFPAQLQFLGTWVQELILLSGILFFIPTGIYFLSLPQQRWKTLGIVNLVFAGLLLIMAL